MVLFSSPAMRWLATVTLGLAAIGLVACGSRSLLDGGEIPAVGSTGGGGAGGLSPSSGGAGGAAPGQGGRGGTGGAAPGQGGRGGAAGSTITLPPIFGLDGGLQVPGIDASVGQPCMDCVVSRCPDVAACAANAACASGVLCTVTRCAGDGGLGNLGCVSNCFGGNWQLAMSAVTGITCVSQGCGATCGLGP